MVNVVSSDGVQVTVVLSDDRGEGPRRAREGPRRVAPRRLKSLCLAERELPRPTPSWTWREPCKVPRRAYEGPRRAHGAERFGAREATVVCSDGLDVTVVCSDGRFQTVVSSDGPHSCMMILLWHLIVALCLTILPALWTARCFGICSWRLLRGILRLAELLLEVLLGLHVRGYHA